MFFSLLLSAFFEKISFVETEAVEAVLCCQQTLAFTMMMSYVHHSKMQRIPDLRSQKLGTKHKSFTKRANREKSKIMQHNS